MRDSLLEETSGTEEFPVVSYKVSKEWLLNLCSEIKQQLMSHAINQNCPKEFLTQLNQLTLDFSKPGGVTISTGDAPSTPPATPTNQTEPEEAVASEAESDNSSTQEKSSSDKAAAA